MGIVIGQTTQPIAPPAVTGSPRVPVVDRPAEVPMHGLARGQKRFPTIERGTRNAIGVEGQTQHLWYANAPAINNLI